MMEFSNFNGSEETNNNDQDKLLDSSTFNLPPRILPQQRIKKGQRTVNPKKKDLRRESKSISQVVMHKSKNSLSLQPKKVHMPIEKIEQGIKSGYGELSGPSQQTILIKEESSYDLDHNSQFQAQLKCQVEQVKKSNTFNRPLIQAKRKQKGKRVSMICKGNPKIISDSAQKVRWLAESKLNQQVQHNEQSFDTAQLSMSQRMKNIIPKKTTRSVISVLGLQKQQSSDFLMYQTQINKDRIEDSKYGTVHPEKTQVESVQSLDLKQALENRNRSTNSQRIMDKQKDEKIRQKRIIDSEKSSSFLQHSEQIATKDLRSELRRHQIHEKDSNEHSISTQPLFPAESPSIESRRLIHIQEKNTDEFEEKVTKIQKLDTILVKLNSVLSQKASQKNEADNKMIISNVYKHHSTLMPQGVRPHTSMEVIRDKRISQDTNQTREAPLQTSYLKGSSQQSQSTARVITSRQLNQTVNSQQSEPLSMNQIIKHQIINKGKLERVINDTFNNRPLFSRYDNRRKKATESTVERKDTAENQDYDPSTFIKEYDISSDRRINISSQTQKRAFAKKGLAYLNRSQSKLDQLSSATKMEKKKSLFAESAQSTQIFGVNEPGIADSSNFVFSQANSKSSNRKISKHKKQMNSSLPNMRLLSRETNVRDKISGQSNCKRPNTSMSSIKFSQGILGQLSKKSEISSKRIESHSFYISQPKKHSLQHSLLNQKYRKKTDQHKHKASSIESSAPEVDFEKITERERVVKEKCQALMDKKTVSQVHIGNVDLQDGHKDQQITEQDDYNSKFASRGSMSTYTIDQCASAIFKYIERKKNSSNFHNQQTAIKNANSSQIISDTKTSVRELNTALNKILIQGGRFGSVVKADTDGGITNIEILQAGTPVFVKIDIEDKSLPARLTIRHKEDDSFLKNLKGMDQQMIKLFKNERKKILDYFPDDLEIYLSMDVNEPGPHTFEKRVSNISGLSPDNSFTIKFGKEEDRTKKKMPNKITMCFLTSQKQAFLDLQCQFEKSEKEKKEEQKQKLLEFKKDQSGGLKMHLSMLSPESKEKELKRIVNNLHNYMYQNQLKGKYDEVSKKVNMQRRSSIFAKKRRLSLALKYELMKASKGIEAEKLMKNMEKKRLAAALGPEYNDKKTINEAIYKAEFHQYLHSRKGPVDLKYVLLPRDKQEIVEIIQWELGSQLSNPIESESSSVDVSENENSESESMTSFSDSKKSRLRAPKDTYYHNLQITQTDSMPSKSEPKVYQPRLRRTEKREVIESKLNWIRDQKEQENPDLKKDYNERRLRANLRKNLLENEFRQGTKKHLKRWEQYRLQKEKYLDKIEWMIKQWIKIRINLSQVKLHQIIQKLRQNFREAKQISQYKLVQSLLAIKFKVRFKLRFQKKFGKVQDERFRKYIVRVLTFNGYSAMDWAEFRSKKLVSNIINKFCTIQNLTKKIKLFYTSCLQIQKHIPKMVEMKNQGRISQLNAMLERVIEQLSLVSVKTSTRFFKIYKSEYEICSKRVDENPSLAKIITHGQRQKIYMDTFAIKACRKGLQISILLDLHHKMHSISKHQPVRKNLHMRTYRLREKFLSILQSVMKKHKGFDTKSFWNTFVGKHKGTFIEQDWTSAHPQQIELNKQSEIGEEEFSPQQQVADGSKRAISRLSSASFHGKRIKLSDDSPPSSKKGPSKKHFGNYKFQTAADNQEKPPPKKQPESFGLISKAQMENSHQNFSILLQGAIEVFEKDLIWKFQPRLAAMIEQTGLSNKKLEDFKLPKMPKNLKLPSSFKKFRINKQEVDYNLNLVTESQRVSRPIPIHVENIDNSTRKSYPLILNRDRWNSLGEEQKKKLMHHSSSNSSRKHYKEKSSRKSDTHTGRMRQHSLAPRPQVVQGNFFIQDQSSASSSQQQMQNSSMQGLNRRKTRKLKPEYSTSMRSSKKVQRIEIKFSDEEGSSNGTKKLSTDSDGM